MLSVNKSLDNFYSINKQTLFGMVPLKSKVALLVTFSLATRYLIRLTQMSPKCGEWLSRDKYSRVYSFKDIRI